MLLLIASIIVVVATIKLLTKLTTEHCKCTDRLDGKTVLITGGNAGIGKATAFELAKRGARLIIASRNIDKSKEVRDKIIKKTQNTKIEIRQLDLSSLKSVRKFASEFLANETRLDILINNAASPGKGGEKTEDGIEIGMQVNHIGHFLLTNLLLDLLKSSAPSRIVVVSSEGHKLFNHRLNPNDLNDLPAFWPKTFSGAEIYCVTKLCNMLMVRELARRLQGTGVTANGLHPGTVRTDMWDPLPKIVQMIATVMTWPFMQTANEASQTTVHVAVSDALRNVSGKYFSNCKEAEKSGMADNDEIARTVWKTSAEMIERRHST